MTYKRYIKLLIYVSAAYHLFIQSCLANDADKSCCNKTPNRFSTNSNQIDHTDMVQIPAAKFMMGGDNHQARKDELPKHQVILHSFWMDAYPVTNAKFAAFVNATKYITTAETKPDWEVLKKQAPPNTPKPDDSLLVPASLVFNPPNHPVSFQDPTVWWNWVPDANWRQPRGPNSTIEGDDHPVVHVSWYDANAFCQAHNKRLPTEAEWEWAARGGLENNIYPWGNDPVNNSAIQANIWQGEFPHNNIKEKNIYTSPVGSYAPNGYGLYDMAGNVWEWVSDWYNYIYYSSLKDPVTDPQGPNASYDPEESFVPKKVIRGGSFLCAENYCTGYRVSARMRTSPDTSMQHLGFRCVAD